MKCNHCGKEFGDGLNCQYCGIDRVEGLGSLIGFDPGSGVGPKKKNGGSVEDKFILCFNCEQVIPSDSEYCPYCQKAQYVICPKCGFRYLAQYPSCYKCGTNRDKYYEQKAAEEQHRLEQEEARRKEEALRREEAIKRKNAEEAERIRQLAREKEAAEAREREKERDRQYWAEKARILSEKEAKWFEEYMLQNKEMLLNLDIKLKKKARRPNTVAKITLVVSIIICYASMYFLDTEFWYLLFVALGLGTIACIIAFSSANSSVPQTIESFLLGIYKEANGKNASHTFPSRLSAMFRRIVVNDNGINNKTN